MSYLSVNRVTCCNYLFSELSLAGQLGLGCVSPAAAPPYSIQAATAAVAAAPSAPLAAAAVAQAAPGKARSSMNLSMISGR